MNYNINAMKRNPEEETAVFKYKYYIKVFLTKNILITFF